VVHGQWRPWLWLDGGDGADTSAGILYRVRSLWSTFDILSAAWRGAEGLKRLRRTDHHLVRNTTRSRWY